MDRRYWPFLRKNTCHLCGQLLRRIEGDSGTEVVVCLNCDHPQGIDVPEGWVLG